MTPQPPTVDELLPNPELAILHALAGMLIAAERALIAAHLELEEMDLCSDFPPLFSGAARIADEILTQIAGLDALLNRYCEELRRAKARGYPPLPF